jgi:hypothetical protein
VAPNMNCCASGFEWKNGIAKVRATEKTSENKRESAAKRELIDTGSDKRYVRRDADGQFNESDEVSRSLAQDRNRKAKRVVRAGQGDRGEQQQKHGFPVSEISV